MDHGLIHEVAHDIRADPSGLGPQDADASVLREHQPPIAQQCAPPRIVEGLGAARRPLAGLARLAQRPQHPSAGGVQEGQPGGRAVHHGQTAGAGRQVLRLLKSAGIATHDVPGTIQGDHVRSGNRPQGALPVDGHVGNGRYGPVGLAGPRGQIEHAHDVQSAGGDIGLPAGDR